MDAGFNAEKPLGYQQLLAAVVDGGTALNVPDGTSLVLISPEGQNIRYRDDGQAPTSTVGMPVTVGTTLRYTGRSPKSIQLISATAGAIVNVLYYGIGF